jgi:ribonucleotide reductase alpha subunit
MNVIDKIQERLENEYVGVDESVLYEQLMDDVSSVLILFRAKNIAIEETIDRLKDYANSSDDYEKAEFAINILKNLAGKK